MSVNDVSEKERERCLPRTQMSRLVELLLSLHDALINYSTSTCCERGTIGLRFVDPLPRSYEPREPWYRCYLPLLRYQPSRMYDCVTHGWRVSGGARATSGLDIGRRAQTFPTSDSDARDSSKS